VYGEEKGARYALGRRTQRPAYLLVDGYDDYSPPPSPLHDDETFDSPFLFMSSVLFFESSLQVICEWQFYVYGLRILKATIRSLAVIFGACWVFGRSRKH
jgi:hypothetical protein